MNIKDALRGAVTALLAGLPTAMIFVVVYRFPIPFDGYSHGIQDVRHVTGPGSISISKTNQIVNLFTLCIWLALAYFALNVVGFKYPLAGKTLLVNNNITTAITGGRYE